MKLAITNFFMPNGACRVHCTTQLLPYNKLTKSKRPRSIKLAILFCTGFSLKAIAQSQTLSKKVLQCSGLFLKTESDIRAGLG